MRKHLLCLTLILIPASLIGVGAVTEPASGQGTVPGTSSSSPTFLTFPKNPYARLFQPRPRDVRQLKDAPASEPKRLPAMPAGTHEPQIECKIRVILADPMIDRGIRMSKPSADTQFAIRILEHPCRKQ